MSYVLERLGMFWKGQVFLGKDRYVLERSGLCTKGQVCVLKDRYV